MYTKTNITRLFNINPTIYGILKDAGDTKMARNSLLAYVDETNRMLNRESHRIRSLELSLRLLCLQTFRKMISVRSERITKYSLVKVMFDLAHNNIENLPEDLNNGFLEEMIRLFKGIQGSSGIYEDTQYPVHADYHGPKAAVLRSEQLDEIASRCLETLNKYPTGLNTNIQKVREKNRNRILSHFNAKESDWENYQWHLKHIIRDSKVLGQLINLSTKEQQAITIARKERLPFGITPYYISLMDKESHRKRDHAVRAQVIPPLDYVEMLTKYKGEKDKSFDFMLENDTSPVPLITRRYPMIVILKPYNTCSQICVYCQRNWEIDDVLDPDAKISKSKLKTAIQWIKDHPAIKEVLVTGGDPLIMPDKEIDNVLSQLAEIEHIERIRLGSRTPVVIPQRITDALTDMVAKYHEPGKREVAVMTHFEHPYEVTPDTMEAVQKFKRRGMSVYNQTVFTFENSRRFEMVALRRILRLIGVDPYYTFNTKGKEETKAYRVPMARLMQEIKEEARLTPGLWRTDEAVYNVPKLGKNYIRAQQHHTLLTILPNGRRVYEFHPWEKNLSLVDTYIDTDVSIYEYLGRLKKRGEKIEDYKTIWYYY